MKVLPMYQVRVRDGKKSSSTRRLLARRLCKPSRSVSPSQQRAKALGQLGISVLERADRLPARNERHAIIHPRDEQREQNERSPEREQRIDPAQRRDLLPILV